MSRLTSCSNRSGEAAASPPWRQLCQHTDDDNVVREPQISSGGGPVHPTEVIPHRVKPIVCRCPIATCAWHMPRSWVWLSNSGRFSGSHPMPVFSQKSSAFFRNAKFNRMLLLRLCQRHHRHLGNGCGMRPLAGQRSLLAVLHVLLFLLQMALMLPWQHRNNLRCHELVVL